MNRDHHKRMTARTGRPHLYWDAGWASWCIRLAGRLPQRLDPKWCVLGEVRARILILNASLDALPNLGRCTPLWDSHAT